MANKTMQVIYRNGKKKNCRWGDGIYFSKDTLLVPMGKVSKDKDKIVYLTEEKHEGLEKRI